MNQQKLFLQLSIFILSIFSYKKNEMLQNCFTRPDLYNFAQLLKTKDLIPIILLKIYTSVENSKVFFLDITSSSEKK